MNEKYKMQMSIGQWEHRTMGDGIANENNLGP